jgi:hypothetical protein
MVTTELLDDAAMGDGYVVAPGTANDCFRPGGPRRHGPPAGGGSQQPDVVVASVS